MGWPGDGEDGHGGGGCVKRAKQQGQQEPTLVPGPGERKGRLLLDQPPPCARSFRHISLFNLTAAL